MKVKTPRRPKSKSVLLVTDALRSHIPSDKPVFTMRTSENGRPNVRYQAETNGLPWLVDIYLGHYYRAQVGNGLGEVCRTIPALVGYLKRNLGVANAD